MSDDVLRFADESADELERELYRAISRARERVSLTQLTKYVQRRDVLSASRLVQKALEHELGEA